MITLVYVLEEAGRPLAKQKSWKQVGSGSQALFRTHQYSYKYHIIHKHYLYLCIWSQWESCVALFPQYLMEFSFKAASHCSVCLRLVMACNSLEPQFYISFFSKLGEPFPPASTLYVRATRTNTFVTK